VSALQFVGHPHLLLGSLLLLQRFLPRNELCPRNVGQGSSGSAGTVSGGFRYLVACS
jgi:hypothetical protein